MNALFNIILKNSKITVFLIFLLSFISLLVTYSKLEINTSTDSLINNNLKFKQNQKRLKDSFKVLNNNILIRLSGSKINEVVLRSQGFVNQLEQNDALSFIFSPNLDDNLKKNFFFLMNDNEKDQLIQKLYDYQPFLSQINNHNNKLEGFNNLLELSLKSESKKDLDAFSQIFEIFNESLASKKNVEWKNILTSQEENVYILIGIDQDYINNHGFKDIYELLIKFKSQQKPYVKVDFTGGLLIDYEEVGSVSSGAAYSGLLSFVLVAILLWFAFKNLYLLLSILLTIALGLIITLGITTLVIGQLNLISVAFAVLFIGLSVDYGIQVCARVKENNNFFINESKENTKKILTISKTLFIASIPSVMGFLSFIPTDYIGLSELGIISAIGLLVGLILNITFLPCLINLFLKKKKYVFIKFNSIRFQSFLFNKKNQILIIFSIILIYSIFNLKKINFDPDALNLKDESLQSVKLAKEMIENNPTSDYVVSIIFDSEQINNFDDTHPIFEDDNIGSYYSYNKIFQKYSSDDFEYLKFLLSKNTFFKSSGKKNEIDRFKYLLDEYSNGNFGKLSLDAKSLKQKVLIAQKDSLSESDINEIFFSNFNDLIEFINNLGSIPDNLPNLIPENYRKRYVSEDNFYRVQIFPSKDLSNPTNLKNFVNVIERFFPNATGMPIVQYNAGLVVTNAFKKAFLISLCFLIVFLFFIFKQLKYVLLCIISLISAFILTMFCMIIFKLHLNFANMIALPLLFSLGISYPIYLLKRFQEFGNLQNLFSSNTPLAIIFSGLTTIFSFSTLYFSSHNGTSSMGQLLFICLSNTLITCLVILPLLIKMFRLK